MEPTAVPISRAVRPAADRSTIVRVRAGIRADRSRVSRPCDEGWGWRSAPTAGISSGASPEEGHHELLVPWKGDLQVHGIAGHRRDREPSCLNERRLVDEGRRPVRIMVGVGRQKDVPPCAVWRLRAVEVVARDEPYDPAVLYAAHAFGDGHDRNRGAVPTCGERHSV